MLREEIESFAARQIPLLALPNNIRILNQEEYLCLLRLSVHKPRITRHS